MISEYLQLLAIGVIVTITVVHLRRKRIYKKHYMSLYVDKSISGIVESLTVEYIHEKYGKRANRTLQGSVGKYGLVLIIKSEDGNSYNVIMEESPKCKYAESNYWSSENWVGRKINLRIRYHPQEIYSKLLSSDYPKFFKDIFWKVSL